MSGDTSAHLAGRCAEATIISSRLIDEEVHTVILMAEAMTTGSLEVDTPVLDFELLESLFLPTNES